MRSEKDFFYEFNYPDKIDAENEGNVEVLALYFANFAYLKPYNKQLNNLLCSGYTVNFQIFDLWTSPRGSVHKARISPLSLEFYSQALARGY